MEFTIARDNNRDLYLDDTGNIAVVSGAFAYAQIVNAVMRTVLGEVQLNTKKGLPYFETVFENPSFIDVWRTEAIIALSELDFVTSVKSFTCIIKGNMLQYTSEIETDNGSISANGKLD